MKNKNLKIYYLISNLIFLISSIYLIYNINLLTGIENFLRYLFMGGLSIFNVILIFRTYLILLKNKNKKIFPYIIGLFIISIIFILISINITRVFSSLNSINKTTVTYSSAIVVLESSSFENVDDLSNKSIGIVSDEDNYIEYELSLNIIDNEKINVDLIIFEDSMSLITALLNKELDAIFINNNYVDIYSSIDSFEELSSLTKILIDSEKIVEKESFLNSNVDILNEPFTILVMGIDSTNENIHTTNSFNGDGLILLTFNPNTLNFTMVSIPRDTYVPIACFSNNKENKITHAAWYGEECMINTITNFTGIDIDYYVKINFKGVVNLVESLNGLDIDVPLSFCEQNSDREFGNQTICIDKGFQTLNGEEVLALARHRKTIDDFQRGLNQQLIIESFISKATSINSLDQVYNILDAISLNIDTNFTTEEILSFYNIGKEILIQVLNSNTDIINIEKLYLSGYDKMIWDDSLQLTLYNYVLYPDSLNEVIEAMQINLNLIEPTIVKNFSYMLNESYEEPIIGKSGNYSATNFQATIPNLLYYTQSEILSWALDNNISVIFEEVESSLTSGSIISQSYPYGYIISNMAQKSITITIAKSDNFDNNMDYIEPITSIPNMSGWTISQLNTWIYNYGNSLMITKIESIANSEEEKALINTVISNTNIGELYENTNEIIIYIMVSNDDDSNNNNDSNNDDLLEDENLDVDDNINNDIE